MNPYQIEARRVGGENDKKTPPSERGEGVELMR